MSDDLMSVIKRMFYLAWKSSRVCGMGAFRDRGPQVSEEDVWRNIAQRGDYPQLPAEVQAPNGSRGMFDADYVFGRMMKMHVRVEDGELVLPDHELRSDYQSWCYDYPSYKSLRKAAERSLAAREQEVASDE